MEASEQRLPSGASGFVAPPVGPGADKVDVKRLAQTLWRQKLLILTIMAILWIPAVLLINTMTPVFSASAVMVIDPHPNRVINIPTVTEPMGIYLDTVNTEVEILRSRDLARRVVETVRLDKEPEFQQSDKPAGPLSRIAATVIELIRTVPEQARQALAPILGLDPVAAWPPPASTNPKNTAGDPADEARNRLIDAFQKNLRISPAVQSRAIRITFDAQDPQLAARVANAMVESYTAMQIEAKRNATIQATDWLQSRLEELKTDMTVTGQATVEAMRSESGLTRGREAPLLTEEMSALNLRLSEARTAHANAQNRLEQLLAINSGKGNTVVGADIIGNPMITALRQRQVALRARLAELREQYGELHPSLAGPTAELRDLNGAVSAEIDRVVRSLRGEVEQQFANVQDLTQRLEGLRGSAVNAMQADVQLRQLQRQADASDDNYRRAVTRLKETQVLEALQMTPDVRVVSAATVPFAPVGPGKTVLAGLAAAICGALAVGVAMVRTMMQRGVYSTHQVEAVLGLPAVGIVPLLGRNGWKNRRGAKAERKNSEFAEAVWRLCARLRLIGSNGEPAAEKGGEVIMLTSSVAGEGKTTLAVALAAFLADTGQRVVIIDCDTRRPAVHRLLGSGRPNVGLTELLGGSATLSEALKLDERRRVAVIAAGRPTANPHTLLGSKAMLSLIVELSERYDVVILDTPPVLSASDALILAPLADRVLYVVRWAHTATSLATAGIKQLREVGGRVSGAVLSMVNVRDHANLEYGVRPPNGRPYLLRHTL